MLDFCLTVGAAPWARLRHDLSKFCAYPPERMISFRATGKGHISISAFWRESHPTHTLSDRVRVDDNGFALLVGYPLDVNLKLIRTVSAFDPEVSDQYDGAGNICAVFENI